MRPNLSRLFLAIVIALSCSSCAVLMNGSKDRIHLRSESPDVKVKIPQLSEEEIALPTTITVPRKKQVITVTVSNDSIESDVYLLPRRSVWMIGNLVQWYFAPVGVIIDATNDQSFNYRGTYTFGRKYGKWYDMPTKEWSQLPRLTFELGIPLVSHNAHPTSYGYIYSANFFGIEGMTRLAIGDKTEFLRAGVGIISRAPFLSGDGTSLAGFPTRSRNHYWIAEYGRLFNPQLAVSAGLQATRYNYLLGTRDPFSVFGNRYELLSSFWQYGFTAGVELWPNGNSLQLRYSPSFYSSQRDSFIFIVSPAPEDLGNGLRYAHTIQFTLKLKAKLRY